MSAGDVVRALWERMEARDWDGARATLADDFADVQDGRIARSVDFWLDDGGDPAPAWRAPFRDPQTPEERS